MLIDGLPLRYALIIFDADLPFTLMQLILLRCLREVRYRYFFRL